MLSRRAGLSAIAGLSCFVRPHFLPCRCRSRLPSTDTLTVHGRDLHDSSGPGQSPANDSVWVCQSLCQKENLPTWPATHRASREYIRRLYNYSLVLGRSQSWNHLRLHAAMTSWTTGTPRLFLVLGNRTWRHFSCLSLLCLVWTISHNGQFWQFKLRFIDN